jgi:predicted secreted protein
MFTDKRSKKLLLLAHCILNQNAQSDGTSPYGGTLTELIAWLNTTGVGIIQIPCPELHCLGLDRGDKEGGTRPVVIENSRIRHELEQNKPQATLQALLEPLVYQIEEYLKYGFEIKGMVGVNRSPSCGVDTTSKANKETPGQGVFVQALQEVLTQKGIEIPFVGIKAAEPQKALSTVQKLVE